MIKIYNLKGFIKKLLFVFLTIFLSILFLFYKNDYATLINDNLLFSKSNISLEKSFSINQIILSSELPFLPSENTITKDEFMSLENIDESNIPLIPDSTSTEPIDNSIPISYTNEYNGVLINNSSIYELTYDMLNPSSLMFSKNNIIIYHTHTCESYTQSENSQYEESRKLSNY